MASGFIPPFCPNRSCASNGAPEDRWYIRKGRLLIKWSGKRLQRYQCKTCGTKFSENTFKDTFRQHKPFLNEQVYVWYSSCATQRRIAINIGCDKKTVVRKFNFLAQKARRVHAWKVFSGELRTWVVCFDEMETHERTRKLPLSVPLAVCGLTGRIIDINVAQMNASGWQARTAREKYGSRPDNTNEVCADVLKTVKIACGERIHLRSDYLQAYIPLVKGVLPQALHLRFKAGRDRTKVDKADAVDREHHPMWWLNQACAMIRHDMSRMKRRTMVNTQRQVGLQRHLWLYVSRRNGYRVEVEDNLWFVKRYETAEKLNSILPGMKAAKA